MSIGTIPSPDRNHTPLKQQPRVLVVAPPRSGFTLLISLLSRLLQKQQFSRDPLRTALESLTHEGSQKTTQAVRDYFQQHIDMNDLVISPEFDLLIGGPKWLSPDDSRTACVRKYIGIRGRGDFLAVFSLPRHALDYDKIVHSHYHPSRWVEEPYYANYLKFSSIRNPVDMLNSACFSLNALTGDYIENHLKRPANPFREKLALNKLTDLNFVEGLITPQVEYWQDYLLVRDRFQEMRWEDLITQPQKTILEIAEKAELPLTATQAAEMWIEMSYKNQTRFHVHNFRKGVIGDSENHLVNEHLEILKHNGFDDFLEELGYEKIQYIDPKDYTLFQRTVAEYIEAGKVHDEVDDRDLFTFAFNKSNFKSTKYDFVSYDSDGPVRIERSSIEDEPLLRGFMDALNRALEPTIDSLNAIHDKLAA